MFGIDGVIAGAAFGIKKFEQFPERCLVGAVPKIGAFAANADEILVAQFIEMVGKGGGGDAEFGDEVADDHAVGMRGEEKAEGAEARRSPDGCEHVGVADGLIGGGFGLPLFHTSNIIELLAEGARRLWKPRRIRDSLFSIGF